MMHAMPIAEWMLTMAANRLSVSPSATNAGPKRVRGLHFKTKRLKDKTEERLFTLGARELQRTISSHTCRS
jgi:hypothetical protein